MSIRRELPSVGLVAFLAICPSLLVAQVQAVVSPGSANVADGTTFDVPVDISQVSDLYAYQFDLSFDPSVLDLLSISEGPFLSNVGSTFFLPGTIDNTAGTATFNADSLVGPISGASGSGELAVFNFEALSEGSTALTLSNVSLLDSTPSNISFTMTDGQVVVSASNVPEPSFLPVLGLMLACTILVARKFVQRAA
jgi:hypothetical protein